MRKPLSRSEWIANRAAAAAANASLDKTMAADTFDDDANASATDLLLSALQQLHPEGDAYAAMRGTV